MGICFGRLVYISFYFPVHFEIISGLEVWLGKWVIRVFRAQAYRRISNRLISREPDKIYQCDGSISPKLSGLSAHGLIRFPASRLRARREALSPRAFYHSGSNGYQ
jgi:hypothetical protein